MAKKSQRLRVERLEQRMLLAADLMGRHNFIDPVDVNDDGEVSAIDALAIVNEITRGARQESADQAGMFADVDGDGTVAPIDCLMVLNHLRRLREAGDFAGPSGRGGEPGVRGERPTPAEGEFRTIDGTGNNLQHDDQGAAGTNIIRFGYPAVYPDGHGDEIVIEDRPNARDVSNRVHAQEESVTNDRHLTDWVVQWGQFLTHDLALSTNDAANNTRSDGTIGDYSIAINDPNDPLGPNPIPFNRSDFDATTGTPDLVDSPFGPRPNWREQVNSVASYIDASNVYGSDDARASALRTFEDGKLKVSEDGLLPQNEEGLENDDPFHLGSELFLAGDVRANEQPGLTSLHTLFVREHNRLADLIKEHDDSLDDEQIYQLARRIVGAEMQIITYNEFLPALLGDAAPRAFDYRYSPRLDASITNSFTTAMFRFGHSMQSPELLLVNNDDEQVGSVGLRDAFFDPSFLRDNPENVDLVLTGLASQVAQENDLLLIDDIRNMLFGPPGAGGLDLAALDIQRGRDHGLPDYNALREFYGLERVESFSEISSDEEVQVALEELYGDIDNIDAFVGAIAEDHLDGASVGEGTAAVIANQFERLRDGDRFFFTGDRLLRSPMLSEVIDLRDVSLAEIIRNNTGVTNIQDNVFFDDSVLRFEASRRAASVQLQVVDDSVELLNRRGNMIDSRAVGELSQVLLIGGDGRRGDRFVIHESIGSADLPDGLLIDGARGRRDVVTFHGGAEDSLTIDGNEILFNDTLIKLDGIERLEIDFAEGFDGVTIVNEGDFHLVDLAERQRPQRRER